MSKRAQEIIEKIDSFQEDEKLEIVSFLLQKSLANKLQMVQLENNVLIVLSKTQLQFKDYSPRSVFKKSLLEIQKYHTFDQIVDPVLWQKQNRDDR